MKLSEEFYMKNSNSEKIISLTFDDGPNLVTTPQVLDILEKHSVPASFFVIGENIDFRTAEVMQRAVKLGCDIQNHSKTHPDMTKLSSEEFISEIEFTSDAIENAVGTRPEFFRPPYIAVNDIMHELTALTFIQGIGAEDYNDEISAEERYRRIMEQASDGAIILLHDLEGNFRTVDALEKIIPSLKEEGYRFVTITELFREKEVEPKRGFMYSNVFQTGSRFEQ